MLKDLLTQIEMRPVRAVELPALEWNGEYTHFRRQYKLAYRDYLRGRTIPWIAVHRREQYLLGQIFVVLNSRNRLDLANGFSRAYLYAIRVKPEYRSKGLGNWMMTFVEDDLVKRGYGFATLNVARDNKRARMFYKRLGYAIVGAEPGQWSYIDHEDKRRFVDEPAWRMEKKLRA